MAEQRILVVYYSRSGNTRSVAVALAAELHADLEELVDVDEREGTLGYLKSGYEALLGRATSIAPLRSRLGSYDLVVVGSPVWASSLSSPVRAFLEEHGGHLPEVAFFVTLGGIGARRVFGQMRALTPQAPIAELAIREREVAGTRALARFALAVDAKLESRAPAPPAPQPAVMH